MILQIIHQCPLHAHAQCAKPTCPASDFIAFLGIQPVPLEFGNKSQ